MTKGIILCVDPGREKCGLAVVKKAEGVLFKIIVDTPSLAKTAGMLIGKYGVETIILGDGTSSDAAGEALGRLESNGGALPIKLIDEHLSSEEARKRYWQDNPPRGLRRLLPVAMQAPPVPIDDYVAVILAERYFNSIQSQTKKDC